MIVSLGSDDFDAYLAIFSLDDGRSEGTWNESDDDGGPGTDARSTSRCHEREST